MKVAVIGTGRMGRHHARVYRLLDNVELVGVVDVDAQRAAAAAQEFGCTAYPDTATLLSAHADLRAASIATPTRHHAGAAEGLLPHGVACLIEKPLAASVTAAQGIVALARRHGALVAVGHTERFNPVVRAVADMRLIPRYIAVDRVSPMTFRSLDVGVVFDLMIHDLDIVLMLARSPLHDVQAVGVSVLGSHEDMASARLTFEDGCVASLTSSRLALKTERKLRVFTENAYLSLDYAQRSGMVLSLTENRELLDRARARLAAGEDLTALDYTQVVAARALTLPQEDALTAELSGFLAAVRGEQAVAVDVDAGFAAVEAAQRVVDAAAAHRWSGVAGQRMGENA